MLDEIKNLDMNDLLPPPLNRIKPDTDDQIIFWGADTILWMISCQEKELAQCSAKITEEQAKKSASKSDRMPHKRALFAIKRLNEKKIKIESMIKILADLRERARNLEAGQLKPRLPICRSLDHFNPGEKVKIFSDEQKQWIDAEIDHRNDHNGSGSVVIGSESVVKRFPGIVKLSEFEFLKRNLDFARLWVGLILLFNKELDSESMFQAIREAK